MVSNLREGINSGWHGSVVKELQGVIRILDSIIKDLYDDNKDEDDIDDAFDQGNFAGRLQVAKKIIEAELPKQDS